LPPVTLPPVAPPPTPPTDPSGGAVVPRSVWVPPAEGAAGGAGEGGERSSPPAAGGGSKASGGAPPTTGPAHASGHPPPGQLLIKSVYDFDNDGFKWTTEDGEYSFGLRGMTQLDTRVYDHTGQVVANNGFYNPRTRIYFEGHFTKPITYEFSFQNTYD